MVKIIENEIITRLKKLKYYSVSVDSTSDEGHIDQLTIIFRYMENYIPVKRLCLQLRLYPTAVTWEVLLPKTLNYSLFR